MSASRKTAKDQTVESMLIELETIVSQLESSKMPLEQSVEAYKKGAELANACQKKLSEIKDSIAVLDAQTQTLLDCPIDSLS